MRRGRAAGGGWCRGIYDAECSSQQRMIALQDTRGSRSGANEKRCIVRAVLLCVYMHELLKEACSMRTPVHCKRVGDRPSGDYREHSACLHMIHCTGAQFSSS